MDRDKTRGKTKGSGQTCQEDVDVELLRFSPAHPLSAEGEQMAKVSQRITQTEHKTTPQM